MHRRTAARQRRCPQGTHVFADRQHDAGEALRRFRGQHDDAHLVIGRQARGLLIVRRPEGERIFRGQRPQDDLKRIVVSLQRGMEHRLRTRPRAGIDHQPIADDRVVVHCLQRQTHQPLLRQRVDVGVLLVMRGQDVEERQRHWRACNVARVVPWAGHVLVIAVFRDVIEVQVECILRRTDLLGRQRRDRDRAGRNAAHQPPHVEVHQRAQAARDEREVGERHRVTAFVIRKPVARGGAASACRCAIPTPPSPASCARAAAPSLQGRPPRRSRGG